MCTCFFYFTVKNKRPFLVILFNRDENEFRATKELHIFKEDNNIIAG